MCESFKWKNVFYEIVHLNIFTFAYLFLSLSRSFYFYFLVSIYTLNWYFAGLANAFMHKIWPKTTTPTANNWRWFVVHSFTPFGLSLSLLPLLSHFIAQNNMCVMWLCVDCFLFKCIFARIFASVSRILSISYRWSHSKLFVFSTQYSVLLPFPPQNLLFYSSQRILFPYALVWLFGFGICLWGGIKIQPQKMHTHTHTVDRDKQVCGTRTSKKYRSSDACVNERTNERKKILKEFISMTIFNKYGILKTTEREWEKFHTKQPYKPSSSTSFRWNKPTTTKLQQQRSFLIDKLIAHKIYYSITFFRRRCRCSCCYCVHWIGRLLLLLLL